MSEPWIRRSRRPLKDKVLDKAIDLITYHQREDEERRYYIALSLVICHPHLDAAKAWEAETGGKVGSFERSKEKIPPILDDAIRFRGLLKKEIEGDLDDRVSFTDYKDVREVIRDLAGEIEWYQRFNGIEPDDQVVGPTRLLREQIAIEEEFGQDLEAALNYIPQM